MFCIRYDSKTLAEKGKWENFFLFIEHKYSSAKSEDQYWNVYTSWKFISKCISYFFYNEKNRISEISQTV